MSEEECCGSICGIAIIIGIIWGIWCAISWAVDTFGWMRVVSVPCIIAAIIVTLYVCDGIWKEATSDLTTGRAFIKLGIAWFILISFISLILDLLFVPYDIRGLFILFISLFLTLPGTCILVGLGTKRLKSCDDENQIREGRKIIYFGILWLIFWLFLPFIINTSDTILTFFMLLLLVAIPGAVTIITFGRRILKRIREGLDVYAHIPTTGYRPTHTTGRLNSYSITNITDVPEHAECPYCHLNIRESFYDFGGVVRCPDCGAFHHMECYQHGCGNQTCRFRRGQL